MAAVKRQITIPLLLAAFSTIAFLFFRSFSTEEITLENHKSDLDPVFPSSFVVAKEESFIRVLSTSNLNPKEGEDFLFVGWFKLRRLPALGEKITFVSKIDSSRRTRPGYAIAVSRDGDSLRPEIYWRDETGKGNWYDFVSMKVPTKSWFMLALSFRKDRYLGLHGGTLGSDGMNPRVELLGGYDLPKGVVPEPHSDLIIGSSSKSSFRGRIGPIGIVAGFPRDMKINTVLRETLENPINIPASYGDVRLWVGNRAKDESAYEHALVYTGEFPMEARARFNPKKGANKKKIKPRHIQNNAT